MIPAEVIAFEDVVPVTEKVLPGHGRQKWITPLAREIQVTAQF